MFKPFYNEEFREYTSVYSSKKRYAFSNYGRLISFTNDFSDGTLLKGGIVEGYRVMRFKIKQKDKIVNKHIYFYREVAKLFIPKKSDDQEFVIHLDFSRSNDHVSNLAWVTKQERLMHYKKSPAVQEALENLRKHNISRDGHKLTESKVRLIKMKIFDPKRTTRLKIIAQRFGISEMQLYRIKSGENWGHVKVEIPS